MRIQFHANNLERSTLLVWAGMLLVGALAFVGSGTAMAGATIVAAVLLATASPSGALYATCAAIPLIFHPVDVGSLQLGLLELGILATTVGTAIRIVFDAVETRGDQGRIWPFPDRIWILPLLLVAIGTASLIWMPLSSHVGEALRTWRWVILEPILLFMLARRAIAKQGAAPLVAAISLPAGFVAGASIWQMAAASSSFAIDQVQRSTATYLHPNNLALYLERALMLVVVPASLLKERYRWGLFALAALIFAGLVTTFSRGALVSISVGVAAVLLAHPIRHGWRYLAAGIAGSIAIFAGIAGARFRGSESSGWLTTREYLWADSMHMLRDFPLTGIGLDQFLWIHRSRYIDPRIWNERYTSHPHNLLLDSWLSLGVGGVALLLMFLTAGCWILWSSRTGRRTLSPWQLGAVACLAAGLGHGMVDNGYFLADLAALTWLAIAILTTGAPSSSPRPDD